MYPENFLPCQWLVYLFNQLKDSADYQFSYLQIYGKGSRPKAALSDLEYSKITWGLGGSSKTQLFDPSGEEKAWFTTETVYSDK